MTETALNFKKYVDRRKFTDKAHELWMNKIYDLFKWQEVQTDKNDYDVFVDDAQHGIDYLVKNNKGKTFSIQERNRTGTNALKYNDITIRYSYPEYAKNNQLSEWFKIESDIMIYSVIANEPTYLSELKKESFYDKIVVINFTLFKQYVNSKHIQVSSALTSDTSYVSTKSNQKILISPLRHNHANPDDSPTDFAVFDINHLYQLDPNLIGYDKGFGTPKDILRKGSK